MGSCDRTVSQLITFVPDCVTASDVPPGEGIPVLEKNMKNLGLGDSSANKSGVACSPVYVQSNAEPGTVNKSQTGLSRFLHACLYISYAKLKIHFSICISFGRDRNLAT